MEGNRNAELNAVVEGLFKNKAVRKVLPNGMTIVCGEDFSAELVSIRLWVKVGSIYEGEHLGCGLAHFTEHMLFKGTPKRDYAAINAEVAAIGSNSNAYTSFEHTVYQMDGPAGAADKLLELLADMAFNSTFSEKEFLKERDVIFKEIQMTHDDPDRQHTQSVFETVFREHPYRYPVIGFRPLFEGISREMLLDFYRTFYVPNNMTLVVVGAADANDIMQAAEKHFGGFAMKSLNTPSYFEESVQVARRSCYLQGAFNVVRGSLAFRIPNLRHPDAPALDILANILGQGYSSILWRKIREEKQLVHDIDVSNWNPGQSGLLWISYLCDAGKREAVEAAILEVLRELKIDNLLLEKAIRQVLVDELNVRKTMSGQSSRLGAAEVVIGDLDYAQTYLRRIQAVTSDQINEIAKKYFIEEGLVSAALEPATAQKTEKQVANRKGLEKFKEIRLKNGVRILLQPGSHFPKVHIRVVMKGGPIFEKESERGITALLATLLTKDTETRSAQEVSDTIENLGGSFSSFSGNNSFGFGLEVIPGDLEIALDIMQQALVYTRFEESTVLKEKEAQIAQVLEQMDDISSYGALLLRKQFFQKHPYSDEPLGNESSIKTLSVKGLIDFKSRMISGNNLVVAVTGMFDPEAIVELLKFLESLPVSEPPALPSFTFPQKSETTQSVDREQTLLFQAYPCLGVLDKDYILCEVLDELLSGMSSNLFSKVREERGLAYFVGASRLSGLNTGMFYLYAGTDLENRHTVFEEFDKELDRIRSGNITQNELTSCKIKLDVQKQTALQSIGGRAMDAALNCIYGLSPNECFQYKEKLESVTTHHLQSFANTYFTPSHCVRLVVQRT